MSLCICTLVQALWHFCCQAKSRTPLVIMQEEEKKKEWQTRVTKPYTTYCLWEWRADHKDIWFPPFWHSNSEVSATCSICANAKCDVCYWLHDLVPSSLHLIVYFMHFIAIFTLSHHYQTSSSQHFRLVTPYKNPVLLWFRCLWVIKERFPL